MNFHQLAKSHRSIRQYTGRDVEDDVLEQILQSGIRASSSGNMQTYSIIVTRDQELKNQLLEPHFNQSMVKEAPVLLTFCADFHRMRRWIRLRQAPENFDNFMSFMIATIDATLVSQNVALAAEAEGLGICYMGTTLASCDKIGEILKLPKNVVPVVGFSLGYAAEDPAPRDRLPLSAMVHQDFYHDPSDAEVLDIYAKREVDGMKRYQSHPALKQQIDAQKISNLAQVYTKLKYTKLSHQEYSQSVLHYLESQGFMNNA